MGNQTEITFEERSNIVLKQAKETAKTVTSWMEFSNIMFDQSKGLVGKSFPDNNERKRFFFTDQSKEIDSINLELMKKFGLASKKVPENEIQDFNPVVIDCTGDGV